MEKRLELENIPWGYELCFNGNCAWREKCMHYQAYLLQPGDRMSGVAVLPAAWEKGACQRFKEVKLVRKAWGFSRIYKNVPNHLMAEARRCVMNYFSRGCGPYYRYHHGDNRLSPSQQRDILDILGKYGSIDDLAFDHYTTDFDFD